MGSFGARLGLLLLIAGVFIGSVAGVIVGAAVTSSHSTTTVIYRPGQGATQASVDRIYVPVTSDVAVVKHSGPAVVQIQHVLPNQQGPFGTTSGGTALGSGFIINRGGDIVTNNHVIAGGNPHYTVTFADGRQAPATLVGAISEYDLAVIHVKGSVPAVARWGDSALLQPGEPVVAIGDPLGQFPNSVTAGIVSGLHRTLPGTCSGASDLCPQDFIQTDAAINHGNSGGPLLDLAGQVIGINTAIQRSTGQQNNNLFSFGNTFGQSSDPNSTVAEGLGFAIPSDTAAPIVAHLIHRIPLPHLGVCYDSVTLLQEERGIPAGARIEAGSGCPGPAVKPNSPASRAGLKDHDVIVTIGSLHLTNGLSLIQAVLPNNPGQTVEVKIWRPSSPDARRGTYLTRMVTFAKA